MLFWAPSAGLPGAQSPRSPAQNYPYFPYLFSVTNDNVDYVSKRLKKTRKNKGYFWGS